MDCQHCGETFPDVSNFETHCKWHSERQAQLRRPKQRQYQSPAPNDLDSIRDSTTSTFSDPSQNSTDPSSITLPDNVNGKTHQLDVSLGPSFQMPSPPANGHSEPIDQPPEEEEGSAGIHSVADILKKFPPYSTESAGNGKAHAKDLECASCHAVFFSRTDLRKHEHTSCCPDSAAVAFVLIPDATHPGGYRIERRLLPFDVSHSLIKCPKCKLSFATHDEVANHQATHAAEYLECVHCHRLLHSSTELESHYDWHDDMEFRHHRNRLRAKQPGLKLQSETGYRDQTNFAVPTFRMKSKFASQPNPMPIIHEAASLTRSETGKKSLAAHGTETNGSKADGHAAPDDFVAISFISAEDLERAHAPNGIYRDPRAEELRSSTPSADLSTPQPAEQPRPVSRDTTSQQSITSLDQRIEANLRPDTPSKKPSSVRMLFRKSNLSSPPVQSDQNSIHSASSGKRLSGKPESANGHSPSRHKPHDSTSTGADFHRLSSILHRVDESAAKGDLAAVKQESDEFLDSSPGQYRPPKQHHVRIHALSSPTGIMVTDVRGVTRILNSQAKEDLTSAVRNMPSTSWARAKVKILSIRADLSSEKDDLSDALWCYQQLLNFVKRFPAIFPGSIWHPTILSQLADISEQQDHPAEAEVYLLEALDSSYNRQGRYDNENVKILHALTMLCQNNGHLRGTAELSSRRLRRLEEIAGPNDKDTLVGMQDFAEVHVKMRNLQAARLLYERSLEGLEMVSDLDDPTMLSIMNKLCDLYVQLNLMDEARALSMRALPAMRLVLGPDHAMTRATLSHYLEHTSNFDFDQHISALLADYRQHPTDEGLWILQGLARSYSLAGLQRDAQRLFRFVFETRTQLNGPQEYATLDALQGRCLALEFMDDIERATACYTHLLQLCSRTPPGHEARKRTDSTRSRLNALRARTAALEEEKTAWGQQGLGPCSTCRALTNSFCLACQIFRFCSEACRDRASDDPTHAHRLACTPSVSLCESKSVSTAESVPTRISQYAVETVQARDLKHRLRMKLYRVAGTFSLSIDPRKFATFRVKLSSPVDTFLLFEQAADVRYAIVDVTMDLSATNGLSTTPFQPGTNNVPGSSRESIKSSRNSVAPSVGDSINAATGMPKFKWHTPVSQPMLVVPRGREVYLLVAPGQTMLDKIVANRRAVRLEDSADWEGMQSPPTLEVADWCQGLVVNRKEWERFGYVIEVES